MSDDATAADKAGASLDQVLRGHTGIVTAIKFHPTNQIGNWQHTKESAAKESNNADADNDGKAEKRRPRQQIASSSSDGTVMIFNIHSETNAKDNITTSGKEDGKFRAYRFIGHRGPIHRIAYSPSGKVLASCSSDNTVRLWSPSRNYSKGDSVVLRGHNGPVRCVDFGSNSGFSNSTNGVDSLLLTASDDKTIKLWSLPKTNFLTSFVGHTNWVRVAKFCQPSSAGNDSANRLTSLAASGGDDKTVRIWSCERATNLATYSYVGTRSVGNSGGGVRDLSFLPSGMSLAACGTDGLTRLFDLRSDAMVQNLDCNNPSSSASLSTADCLSVHPDGNHLLCSTSDSARDGRVLLFDLRLPTTPLFSVPSISSIGNDDARPRSAAGRRRTSVGSIPTSVTFSPDGARFAVSLKDNAVRIYKWNCSAVAEETNQTKSPHWPREDRWTPPTNEVVTKDVAHHRDAATLEETNHRPQESLPLVDDAPRNRCDSANSTTRPWSCNSSWKYRKDDLPEILSSTLDQMVGQLDILAQTVILLERRLAIQESAMEDVQRMQKQIVGIPSKEDDVLSSGQKVDMSQPGLQQPQPDPPCRQEVNLQHAVSQDNSTAFSSYMSTARGDEDTLSVAIDERVQSIMKKYSLLLPNEAK